MNDDAYEKYIYKILAEDLGDTVIITLADSVNEDTSVEQVQEMFNKIALEVIKDYCEKYKKLEDELKY